MTKKERWIVDDAGTLIDMVTRDTFDIVEDVVDVLNDLDSENTHLKYSLGAYIVDLNNYKGKCSALEQENEQLKQVIAEDEKIISSTYDELTKLRRIKKNLVRIKTQWDWIMEAVQYD